MSRPEHLEPVAGREPASSCQQDSQARAYSKARLAPLRPTRADLRFPLGLLVPRQPRLPAQAPHQGGHPGEEGPGRQPQEEGQPGRPPEKKRPERPSGGICRSPPVGRCPPRVRVHPRSRERRPDSSEPGTFLRSGRRCHHSSWSPITRKLPTTPSSPNTPPWTVRVTTPLVSPWGPTVATGAPLSQVKPR